MEYLEDNLDEWLGEELEVSSTEEGGMRVSKEHLDAISNWSSICDPCWNSFSVMWLSGR